MAVDKTQQAQTETKRESVTPAKVEDTPKAATKATTAPKAASKAPAPQKGSQQPAPANDPIPAQAPLLLIRPDAKIFDTNIWRTLTEKRRAVIEDRLRITADLTHNALTLHEIEEQVRFLLTPSPLFNTDGTPGSDELSQTLGKVEGLARDILNMVGDRASKEDVALITASVGQLREGIEAGQVNPADPANYKLTDLLEAEGGELGQQGDEDAEDEPFDPDAEPESGVALAEEPPAEEEEPVEDFEWRDAYMTPRFPALDELPLDLVSLVEVGELTVVALDDMSSSISEFGCEVARKSGVDVACIYIRYKQVREGKPTRLSNWYRYTTFHADVWAKLVAVTRDKFAGLDVSIGSWVAHNIKDAHERKVVLCQQLTPEGSWIPVQTRAEKKEGQQAPAAQRPQAAPVAKPVAAPPAPAPMRATVQTPAARTPQAQPRAGMASVRELMEARGDAAPTLPATRRPVTAPPTGGDDLEDVFR
jgi:hypothetical protein